LFLERGALKFDRLPELLIMIFSEIVDSLNLNPEMLERKPIIELAEDEIQSFADIFIEGIGGRV